MGVLLKVLLVISAFLALNSISLTSGYPASSDDDEGSDTPLLGGGGGVGVPERQTIYRSSVSGPVIRRSQFFTDSAYVPYIHPRYILAQDGGGNNGEGGDNPNSGTVKRASKGMLVDVVDFVTKGKDPRHHRLGDNLRNSGRRR